MLSPKQNAIAGAVGKDTVINSGDQKRHLLHVRVFWRLQSCLWFDGGAGVPLMHGGSGRWAGVRGVPSSTRDCLLLWELLQRPGAAATGRSRAGWSVNTVAHGVRLSEVLVRLCAGPYRFHVPLQLLFTCRGLHSVP